MRPRAARAKSKLTMKTRFAALLISAIASIATTPVSSASASVGFELDATTSSRSLPGPPRGIAIDQANHDIYVAITSMNPSLGMPGQINRFNSDLSADGVFSPGGGFYSGVAVNPVTQGFYASQIQLNLSLGTFGIPRLDRFSPSGSAEGTFPLPDAGSFPPIATDSTGRIFFPNSDGHTVEIYSSAGALQQTITCSDCPGGLFGRPISVATDSANNLYVADVSPDRVVKLSPSGGGAYVFASLVQSGLGAVAVAVDSSTGDVLVGDLPGGTDYHIVAYNSAGTKFDDFGAGLFADPPQSPPGAATNLAYQMAINSTTHKLYVGENNKFYIFEKTTIDPPTATIKPATNIGQLTATMNATVNAKGHATSICELEYTLNSDVGFADATSLPCSTLPDGEADTSINVPVSGLEPATAYRYRMNATSHAGSVTSASQTFETLPELPPSATTEAPTEVTQTTARIKGSVDPEGGSVTDCHFEFGAGTGASYESSLPCQPPPGPVSTPVAQSRKVSSLKPATTYHYRLVLTTNAGTAEGNDVQFTTVSPPDPEPEPEPGSDPVVAPPPVTQPPVDSPTRFVPRTPRCKQGFRRRNVGGKARCVKVCRRGFRKVKVRRKVRCVKARSPRR